MHHDRETHPPRLRRRLRAVPTRRRSQRQPGRCGDATAQHAVAADDEARALAASLPAAAPPAPDYLAGYDPKKMAEALQARHARGDHDGLLLLDISAKLRALLDGQTRQTAALERLNGTAKQEVPCS